MTQVNIHVAKAHLSELIQKALLGEEVIIARDNKPLVKLIALTQPATRTRRIGLAKGQVTLSPDFDSPLDDFRDYEE